MSIKKSIVSCLAVFIILGCGNNIIACQSKTDEWEENTEKSMDAYESRNNETKESFDILSMVEPGESDFDKLVSQNHIDVDYENELQNATTTIDFIALEKKYIDVWKKEIEINKKHLVDVLSPETMEKLNETQKTWETQIKLYLELNQEILATKSSGSSAQWLVLSDVREQYRERAFYFMYLLYVVE